MSRTRHGAASSCLFGRSLYLVRIPQQKESANEFAWLQGTEIAALDQISDFAFAMNCTVEAHIKEEHDDPAHPDS
jgi:hypothetical protein